MLRSLALVALLALSATCVHVHNQRLPIPQQNSSVPSGYPIPGGINPNSFINGGSSNIGPIPGGVNPNNFINGGSSSFGPIPGGINPNNFIQPTVIPSPISNACPPRQALEQDGCLKRVGDSFANARPNSYPYSFSEPKIIVCYFNETCAAQRQRCQYADYCMNRDECNAAVLSYSKCAGSVNLLPIPRNNMNVPNRR